MWGIQHVAMIRPAHTALLESKSGSPGLSKDVRGLKWGPFGGPRNAVVFSSGAQAHEMDATHPVKTTSGSRDQFGPQGMSEVPKRAFLGKTGPFGCPRTPGVW